MRKITEAEYLSLFKENMIGPVPTGKYGIYMGSLLKKCLGKCQQTAKKTGLIDEYGQMKHWTNTLVDHELILGYKGAAYSNRCPILFSFPYLNFEILSDCHKELPVSNAHLFLVNPRWVDYIHWDNEEMTTMCLAIVPEFPNWKQQLELIEEAVGDDVFFDIDWEVLL